MADVLGARLLSEVQEETLDQVCKLGTCVYSEAQTNVSKLLHSLRSLNDPAPTDRLGVPALDRLLDIFSHPPPLHQDTHQQWGSPPSPSIDLPIRKPKSPVIELCSASPCAGKTQLLYLVTAASLLPRTHGGNGGAVVWLETDSRFCILRLRSALSSHIATRASSADLSPLDLDALVTASLQHLHVFSPSSSASLLATLLSLPSYLFSPRRHSSAARALSTLIVSNISAFVYQDRLDADQSPHSPGSNTFVQRYRDLVAALRVIQATFSCTVVAGNVAFAPLLPNALGLTVRPHLPAAWSAFCPLKVLVMRETTPKFGPGISAEEAAREAPARREVVQRKRFRGWVDVSGSETWEAGTKGALEALEGNGAFAFRVDREGLRIGENGD
ncbi:hypothetical protein MMC32_003313 [Xylographa parallela]|nr:hypothetical protein [Xylographa parallela]